jgi:lipoate-protein ligase A
VPGWAVDRISGSAAELHQREWPHPLTRTVWLLEVTAPALVLGSAQATAIADAGRAASAGVDVVRRRSGGGAVLLEPGTALWVDVFVPRGDPHWDDDVGGAFHWLGATWAAALADHGTTAAVHEGPMVRRPWSDVVCFAGLGPGEVTVEGRKVVGLSQRRTRAGARFQCLALERWDPEPTLALLRLDPAERPRADAELREAAAGAGAPLADLESSFLRHLPA